MVNRIDKNEKNIICIRDPVNNFFYLTNVHEYIFKNLCILINKNYDIVVEKIEKIKKKLAIKMKKSVLMMYNTTFSFDVIDFFIFCISYSIRIEWNYSYNQYNKLLPNIRSESGIFVKKIVKMPYGIVTIYNNDSLYNLDSIVDEFKIIIDKILGCYNWNIVDNYNVKCKIKKLSHNENITLPYDITLDIDFVAGVLKQEDIINFTNGSFMLMFDPYSKKKIRSKSSFLKISNEILNVNKTVNYHLGYFNTNIGKVDCFIHLCKKNYNSMYVVKRIFTSLENLIINESKALNNISNVVSEFLKIDKVNPKIGGIIRKSCICNFFQYLNYMLYDVAEFNYFIEILGNKKLTSTNNVEQLLFDLNNSFNLSLVPSLSIDVCVQVHSKGGGFVVPKEEFFKTFNISSCFNIFYDKQIKAYNGTMIQKTVKKLLYCCGPVEKINFYSTIEDIIKEIRNPSYIPLISMWYFQNFIHSSNKNEKKINKYINKIKTFGKTPIEKNVPYRFELRVKPLMLIDTIRLLVLNLENNVTIVDTNKIELKLKQKISEYIDYLRPSDLDEIFNLFIVEMAFNRLFLMGDVNPHVIPSEMLDDYSSYANNADTDKKLSQILDNVNIITMKIKMITLSRVYRQYNPKDIYIKSLDDLFKYGNINDALDSIIKLIKIEVPNVIKERHNNFNDNYFNKSTSGMELDACKLVEDLFIDKNKFKNCCFKKKAKLLSKIYKVKIIDWINTLKRNNFNCFYNISKYKFNKKLYKIRYTKFNNYKSKSIELKKLASLESMINAVKYNNGIKRDKLEIIKVLYTYAYSKIHSLKWQDVYNTCFFGLHLCRNFSASKEFLKYFKRKNKKKYEFIYHVANFDPNNYSIYNNLQCIYKFYPDLIENIEFERIYEEVYKFGKMNFLKTDGDLIINFFKSYWGVSMKNNSKELSVYGLMHQNIENIISHNHEYETMPDDNEIIDNNYFNNVKYEDIIYKNILNKRLCLENKEHELISTEKKPTNDYINDETDGDISIEKSIRKTVRDYINEKSYLLEAIRKNEKNIICNYNYIDSYKQNEELNKGHNKSTESIQTLQNIGYKSTKNETNADENMMLESVELDNMILDNGTNIAKNVNVTNNLNVKECVRYDSALYERIKCAVVQKLKIYGDKWSGTLRVQLFTHKKRPSLTDWDYYINLMEKNNIINISTKFSKKFISLKK